jgi:FeS assembly SUF system protein
MPEPVDMTKPPLNAIEKSLLEAEIVEAIRTVYDPEIPVNVYDLGLIYGIDVKDDRSVHVMMTLTSPACPVAGTLPGEVETMVRSTPGVGEVAVELTWDPPFTIERMSEDVRLMLGL